MADVCISAIVAIDNKRGMGRGGTIPWHIPGEQKRFKEITTPHPMIMGRKTFTSIGRVLPGRPHIIVTRDTTFSFPNTTVVHSLGEAIEKAKEMDHQEIFIIGGGEIFKEAMPIVARLYLTIIEQDFACDTFFPDYREFTKVIEKEEHRDNDPAYTYLTLEREVVFAS